MLFIERGTLPTSKEKKSAGMAGVSSGMGLGDGLLVCPCASALVSLSCS